MPFVTLNLGIQLTIPTNGTRNWGTTVYNTTWTKISQHKHQGSGDGAQLVTASYTDRSVTSIKLEINLALVQAATVTPAGTTQTLDFNNGNIQKIDLGSASGDVTLTLSNPKAGAKYRILAVQGATPRNLVWPAAVKWANGQAPILSTANGSIDMIWLYYDGTNYFGGWDVAYA